MFRVVGRAGAVLAVVATGCANLAAATSGRIGCPASEIEISDDQDHAGSRTWTANCRGRVYYCSATIVTRGSGAIDCTPESGGSESSTAEPAPQPRSARPEVDAPSGAAGFEFGMAPEAARQACEDAGFAFDSQGGWSECAGAPTGVGMEASVRLRFCAGKLCTILIKGRLDPKDGALWKSTFLDLQRALTSKYGEPTRRELEWPAGCREDAELIGCLEAGTADLKLVWKWGPSNGIALAMGPDRSQQGGASLRITYLSERVNRTRSTGGL
ncbi:MAG: hypothetical protein JW940_25400 [Polyangiaceae bacterium]|nr:hypothetical protein [Polyangiaceae bacterium]